jgi:hypothetical protein
MQLSISKAAQRILAVFVMTLAGFRRMATCSDEHRPLNTVKTLDKQLHFAYGIAVRRCGDWS